MKNRNTTHNNPQIELGLPPTPFFHVRRHSPPRPKHRIPLHRSRFWFQRMHALIDAIPDPATAVPNDQ
jgi:hypothetical protein